MTAPWRVQPVFITSTFQDMQAERDYLLAYVFPSIAEWLATTAHRHLEWVDLRVGAAAEDEGARESKLLRVCLDEVRRARPFVVALLGDRYGWVPAATDAAAAAAEIGFASAVAGRSVTDLEISFGLLDDVTKSGRSLVFLRSPLPYDDMPPELAAVYSDARATDAGADQRAEQLTALKARLRHQLPQRCFEYDAVWDPAACRVTGLDQWGRLVESQLRAALEAEFGSHPAAGERDPAEVETEALEEFIEERTRGFVGRKASLHQIDELLQPPSQHGGGASPTGNDRPWAICISGPPGTGKTAFFGETYNRLVAADRPDTLVLAHAAGAGTHSGSLRFMVHRFLHQLVTSPDSIQWFRFTDTGEILHKDILGAGLSPDATDEQLYAALRLTLLWAAQVRHVVVLIDGLDQFAPSDQASFIGWASGVWPPTAQLVVTTQPTPAIDKLSNTVGVVSLTLPAFDTHEARDVVSEISGRYHRRLPAAVLDAIAARRDDAAWSLPLGLVIAAEQINLLDADDFARARRDYQGRDDQRITSMMVDLVAGMPADVPALYRTVMARAERAFGSRTVSRFLGAITLSRFGWRESDFRALMPAMTGEPWDDLRFATLRRLFRGHLRLRQPLGRWDVVHSQLRDTVRDWLAEINVTPQQIHTSAAAHLLALPASDPVRHAETVYHLFEAEDWAGAARYLASVESDGLEGALGFLADALRTPLRWTREEFATRLTNLLHVPGLDDASLTRLADRLFHAHFRSQGRSSLAAEQTILLALDEVLSGLVERHRGELPLLKTHLKCLNFLGHSLKDAGNLDAAVRAYERSAALAREIDSLEGPRDAESAHDPIPFGDALFARRDFAGALVYYRRAAAAGRSEGHGRVGVALRMLGDLKGSLAALREGLTLQEQQVAENPRSAPLRFNLGLAHSTVASTLAEMNDYDAANESYRRAMDLMSPIAAQHPSDPHVQTQWAQIFLKVAIVRQKQGDLRAAVELVARGRPIMNDVLAAHGDNPNYWRDAAMFDITWGDLSRDLGDNDAAVDHWRAAEKILQDLVRHDSRNAQWQHDLQVTRLRIEQA